MHIFQRISFYMVIYIIWFNLCYKYNKICNYFVWKFVYCLEVYMASVSGFNKCYRFELNKLFCLLAVPRTMQIANYYSFHWLYSHLSILFPLYFANISFCFCSVIFIQKLETGAANVYSSRVSLFQTWLYLSFMSSWFYRLCIICFSSIV